MGLVISREGGRFAMTAVPRFSVPVAVIMGRRMVSRSGWRVPSWRVVGVVAGDNLPGRQSRAVSVHRAEDEEHFLWGGLQLELYRDATEAYWSNLMGQQPSLFVLCAETENGALEPQFVTADMHEASSGTEGEDLVFAAPIPPEVYQQLERFVVEHHRPEEKRKRKRTDWNADKPA
jgi:hypothetical protein